MALLFVATLRSKLLFSLRLFQQRKSGLGSAINSVKNVTRLFKKQATKILKKAVKKIGKEFLGETIEGFAADGIQFGTQKYMEGYFKYMGMAK